MKRILLLTLVVIASHFSYAQNNANLKMRDPKTLQIKIDTTVFNKKYSPTMFYSEKHKVLLMVMLPEMSYAYAIQDMEKAIKGEGMKVVEKKTYQKGNNEITYVRVKNTKGGKEELNDTYIIKDALGKVTHVHSQIPLLNNEAVTKAVKEAAESVKTKK